MATVLFAKTEAGREEIATRKLKLSPKLRSMLVMVNGKLSLMELVAAMGSSETAVDLIDELLAAKLIEAIFPDENGNIPSPQANQTASGVNSLLPKWPPD